MSNKIDKWVNDLLNILDEQSLNPNGRIVQSKFSNINEDIVKAVTGNRKSEFKEFLRQAPQKMQDLYGLTVKRIRGGGLEPVNLIVPYEIGQELGRKLLQEADITDGNAQDKLLEAMPELGARIHDVMNIDITKTQWLSNFKEGFKSAVRNHERFSFSTSSFNFTRVKENIIYNGTETQLEKRLVSSKSSDLSAKFQVLWNIEIECLGNDNARKGGVLANPDITVVGKRRMVERDELRIAAMELKRDNKVESVFKALSQAAAYRALANEVWIIAPGLRESEFSSAEQYHSFITQCRDNGFGVLTLDLTEDCSEIRDMQAIVRPRENAIMNPSLQRQAIDQLRLGYCSKCSRFYSDGAADDDTWAGDTVATTDCGWLIGDKCARRLEESMLARHALGVDSKEGEGRTL